MAPTLDRTAIGEPMVETMTGPISVADLGFTLMHEHIIVQSEGVAHNFPSVWDEQAELDEAVQMLSDLKASRRRHHRRPHGPRHRPRHSRACCPSSRRRESRSSSRPASTPSTSCRATSRAARVDEMADLFVADITDGIQGTDVRAAVLKCATDAARRHPRRREGAAGGRAGASAHRRSHHHAHARRHATRPRAAGRLRRARASTWARHHRPQRRQRRPRLPDEAARPRLLHRHGPLRPRHLPARREARRHRRRSSAGWATPSAWSSPTTPASTSTCYKPDLIRQFVPNWNYLHISITSFRRCWKQASPRRRSTS